MKENGTHLGWNLAFEVLFVYCTYVLFCVKVIVQIVYCEWNWIVSTVAPFLVSSYISVIVYEA